LDPFDRVFMLSVPVAVTAFWLNEARPSSESRLAQPAAQCSYPCSAEFIDADVAAELARCSIVELRGVLRPGELAAARRDIVQLIADQDAFGATGNAEEIRQDRVAWVQPSAGGNVANSADPGSVPPRGAGLEHCVRLLRGVAHALQVSDAHQDGRLHLVPLDCQLATFRGDKLAGYRAHYDTAPSGWKAVCDLGPLGFLRARDERRRIVTAILYLNESDWDSGGELACYLGAKPGDNHGSTATEVKRIVPTGGTLLLFDSTTVLHAVQPSCADRHALTAWIWNAAA
jgi:hypothetical protein